MRLAGDVLQCYEHYTPTGLLYKLREAEDSSEVVEDFEALMDEEDAAEAEQKGRAGRRRAGDVDAEGEGEGSSVEDDGDDGVDDGDDDDNDDVDGGGVAGDLADYISAPAGPHLRGASPRPLSPGASGAAPSASTTASSASLNPSTARLHTTGPGAIMARGSEAPYASASSLASSTNVTPRGAVGPGAPSAASSAVSAQAAAAVAAAAAAAQLADTQDQLRQIRDVMPLWTQLRLYDDEHYQCRTCAVPSVCAPCALSCHLHHDLAQLPRTAELSLLAAMRQAEGLRDAELHMKATLAASAAGSASPTTPQSIPVPWNLLNPTLSALGSAIPTLLHQRHCACGDAPRRCAIGPYRPRRDPQKAEAKRKRRKGKGKGIGGKASAADDKGDVVGRPQSPPSALPMGGALGASAGSSSASAVAAAGSGSALPSPPVKPPPPPPRSPQTVPKGVGAGAADPRGPPPPPPVRNGNGGHPHGPRHPQSDARADATVQSLESFMGGPLSVPPSAFMHHFAVPAGAAAGPGGLAALPSGGVDVGVDVDAAMRASGGAFSASASSAAPAPVGSSSSAYPSAAPSAADEWVSIDHQLAELLEMGFTDLVLNAELLRKHGGSLDRALIELCQRGRDGEGG